MLIVSDDRDLTALLGDGLVDAECWTSANAEAISVSSLASSDIEPNGADRIILSPAEPEDLAAEIGRAVTAGREAHPELPWADDAARDEA